MHRCVCSWPVPAVAVLVDGDPVRVTLVLKCPSCGKAHTLAAEAKRQQREPSRIVVPR